MTPQTDIAALREQLNWDVHDEDLLNRKLCAAEAWIANHTGKAYDPTSPTMLEACLQLAAYWFEQREAASEVRLSHAPFSVYAILQSEKVQVTGYVAS